MKTKYNVTKLMTPSKSVLREKFIAINIYIKKQLNNLTLQVKELEKGEQTNPKGSRGKEIMKIGTEINEIDNRKIVGKNQ